jgi:hypothetical protein
MESCSDLKALTGMLRCQFGPDDYSEEVNGSGFQVFISKRTGQKQVIPAPFARYTETVFPSTTCTTNRWRELVAAGAGTAVLSSSREEALTNTMTMEPPAPVSTRRIYLLVPSIRSRIKEDHTIESSDGELCDSRHFFPGVISTICKYIIPDE